jgi:hypothetical protein
MFTTLYFLVFRFVLIVNLSSTQCSAVYLVFYSYLKGECVEEREREREREREINTEASLIIVSSSYL